MAIRLAARIALALWLLQPAARLVCASSCLPQPMAPLASACHESSDHDPVDSNQPRMTSSPACVDAQSSKFGIATSSPRQVIAMLEPVSEWTSPWAAVRVTTVDRAPAEISPPPLLVTVLRI